jgi:Cytochrome C oxidase, cbb3-type, subunit III
MVTEIPMLTARRSRAAIARSCALLPIVATGAFLSCQPVGAQSEPGPLHRVECPMSTTAVDAQDCRVDLSIYLGYRVFAEFCSTCHAPDALGSSFAPNLLERVASMDKSRFLSLMERGYVGRAEGMAAWGENPYVSRYYEELWAYLGARASGALPPGEPRLAREDEAVSPR